MKTYQIALPDEVAEFVDRMLADGKWGTIDDLILYGLARTQDDLRMEDGMDQDALRKAVQIGIDQANRGEVSALDMDAIFERATQRLQEAEKVHAGGDANGSG